MEDKSPSFCRLCNIDLASPSAWRQHAKSDWQYVSPIEPPNESDKTGEADRSSGSVYNLRVRVAEPGTVVEPPTSRSGVNAESNSQAGVGPSDDVSLPSAPSTNTGNAVDVDGNKRVDDESDDGDEDSNVKLSTELVEFNSKQCLFCGAENSSFDDNLAHMSKSHSFSIPYQEHLTADLETLVEYLYLVIYGYAECILCAALRNSVQGIQHHMTAKGHCRFNVASDPGIAEFYDIPAPEYQADEESLRLPSGKLLSHRTLATGPASSRTAASRTARQAAERHLEPATTLAVATQTQSSELVPTPGNDGDVPAPPSSTQFSRLTRGDQQSLAHLPDHAVRSLLVRSARDIAQSRREETQTQLRLEQAGNTTLTGHFRMDTSKRFRGPWG